MAFVKKYRKGLVFCMFLSTVMARDTLQVIDIPKEGYRSFLSLFIQKSKQSHQPIAIVGSRHSQGGQNTLTQKGTIINLSNLKHIKMITNDVVSVQAGAQWKNVLEYLDKKGLSVAIMQSDHDFTLGGTVATNVHGWQANKPPFIDSVVGLHMMASDGLEHYCDSSSESDLFHATIGGYGLLGIVTDAHLRVVPNVKYRLQQEVIDTASFSDVFQKSVVNNPKARMFFARLSLHDDAFLSKIVIRVYEETTQELLKNSLSNFSWTQKLLNWLFHKTKDSNFFKKLRWHLETSQILSVFYSHLSRNQLLYHSTHNYVSKDPHTFDCLHEYFVPYKNVTNFVNILKGMKSDLQESLMNVTIRQVLKDNKTVLSYAHQDMISFVLFFRGPKSTTFDNHMQHIAVRLTDEAIRLEGSYYLPYRPYQSKEQFLKAYPSYNQFKKMKTLFDPHSVFQNIFYEKYLK